MRADLSSLEDQLQKAKEFFMDTNMKAMEAIRQEHADKEKESVKNIIIIMRHNTA